ncbi:MAG: HAMP domain-containing histidine kinase [Chthonomonadales bacterium]|nr:HAMP domain-containing histidine kinase [Chthonomonadales bacterium]
MTQHSDAPENAAEEPTLGGALPVDPLILDELTRLNNEMAALQRDLARQKARLERLNELKDEFLGMAAHDLRMPLTAVVMYATFLEEDAGDRLTPEMRRFLQTIRLSGERMLRLVNHLLDVSVIESGRLQLDLGPTDVGEVARSVVEMHRAIALRKNVNVTLNVRGQRPIALADAARLDQVLSNLVNNAVKFSADAGSVAVTVEQMADEVRVSVSDQGVGIAPEDLSQLFTPFGLRSSTGTAGEQGTGLGLAICKRIVAAHRGRIWAESTPGKGSVFHVALPTAGSANLPTE